MRHLVSAAALAVCAPVFASHVMAHEATIRRDQWGIAHIHGRSDADAVYGMMYAQAEDDLPRIERNYLAALGRLAEADGDKAIWADLRQRLFIDAAVLKREYAASPSWLKALLNGWADGLNRYVETHPAPGRTITRYEPWMPLAFSEGSIGGDIERGVNLVRLRGFYEGSTAAPAALAQAGRLVEPKGSNGIAIGPTKSTTGHPLLWINPHTSFFFRAEQQVVSDAGLDVYGAATWGQFFIYQGFNRRLGWMHTSSGVDNIDEFAMDVKRAGKGWRYRFGTEWRPVRERATTIAYRRPDGTMGQRRFVVFTTQHGPVIRQDGARWVSVAMLNAPRAALEQSFLRTRATTLPAYMAVAKRRANSSNNTILAVADGTIAYLHPQFVPVRDARFDYTRAVDGGDPRTAWRGLHQLADLPQVVRPASGWVANTNNAPWSAAGADSPRAAAFPRYMDQFGENPRGLHATSLLAASKSLSPQGLRDLAFDSRLPFFERQIPLLERAIAALPADDPRKTSLAGPLALLSRWDRRWSAASEPTSLAVHWGEALWASEGPLAAAARVPLFGYLADRTTDAARIAAFDTAVQRMTREQGGWRVPWGSINRFQRLTGAIRQQFDDRSPSIPIPFTSGNFGSLASFGVERQPGTHCFYGTSGNSFVALVEFGPQVRAWAVSAGGESGDPGSAHFNDQAQRYATGDLRPILLDESDLAALAPYRPGDERPVVRSPAPPRVEGRCGER